ncbi:hypothetical protein [Variovorax jilinensis]|uniref:hypothetical protein n=1 Tax=Variovorax jilinensis TaxID=3053513 RepID=UPI0025775B93|nr:hypothetical protein [Variovorax sp. J22P168]
MKRSMAPRQYGDVGDQHAHKTKSLPKLNIKSRCVENEADGLCRIVASKLGDLAVIQHSYGEDGKQSLCRLATRSPRRYDRRIRYTRAMS